MNRVRQVGGIVSDMTDCETVTAVSTINPQNYLGHCLRETSFRVDTNGILELVTVTNPSGFTENPPAKATVI